MFGFIVVLYKTGFLVSWKFSKKIDYCLSTSSSFTPCACHCVYRCLINMDVLPTTESNFVNVHISHASSRTIESKPDSGLPFP